MYKVDHMRSDKFKKYKGNRIVTGVAATALMVAIVVVAIFMVQTVTRKPNSANGNVGVAENLVTASPDALEQGTETMEDEVLENEKPVLTEQEIADYKRVSDSLTKANITLESKFAAVMSPDGTILFGQQENRRMNPASMTKLMTALLIVENISDLKAQVEVSRATMNYTYDQDGSNAGFAVGEKASILDMLYGVLLPSGAECSVTLAEYVAGSHGKFVGMMNKRAAELGMTGTHFTNCVGFNNKNHYSTAKDMAILLNACLKNDTIKQILTEKSHKVGRTNMHKQGFTFYSTVYKKIRKVNLNGMQFLGGKTGYTDEAGQCLASAAIIRGKQYVLVTGCSKTAPDGIAGSAMDVQTVYQTIRTIK